MNIAIVLLAAVAVLLGGAAVVYTQTGRPLSNAARNRLATELARAAKLEVSDSATLLRYYHEHRPMLDDALNLRAESFELGVHAQRVARAAGSRIRTDEVIRFIGALSSVKGAAGRLRRIAAAPRGGWQ